MPAPYRKRHIPSTAKPQSSFEKLFASIPATERAGVRSIWWLGCHRCEEMGEIKSLFPGVRQMTMADPLINDLVVVDTLPIAGMEIAMLPFAVTSREWFEGSGGRLPFYLTSNDGASSSLRKMAPACTQSFPTVTPAGEKEVDIAWLGILGEPPDALIMDIQGCEYDVMCDAMDVVRQIKFIYAEVCHVGLYEGQKLFHDIMLLLESDFSLVGSFDDHGTYGNALWRRK